MARPPKEFLPPNDTKITKHPAYLVGTMEKRCDGIRYVGCVHACMHADRQIGRQADRQTDGQTDRQTDIQCI